MEGTRTNPDACRAHWGIITGKFSLPCDHLSANSEAEIQLCSRWMVYCRLYCFNAMTSPSLTLFFPRKLILNFSGLSYTFATNIVCILLRYFRRWSDRFASRILLSLDFRTLKDSIKSYLQVTNIGFQIFVGSFYQETSHDCVCICKYIYTPMCAYMHVITIYMCFITNMYVHICYVYT